MDLSQAIERTRAVPTARRAKRVLNAVRKELQRVRSTMVSRKMSPVECSPERMYRKAARHLSNPLRVVGRSVSA